MQMNYMAHYKKRNASSSSSSSGNVQAIATAVTHIQHTHAYLGSQACAHTRRGTEREGDRDKSQRFSKNARPASAETAAETAAATAAAVAGVSCRGWRSQVAHTDKLTQTDTRTHTHRLSALGSNKNLQFLPSIAAVCAQIAIATVSSSLGVTYNNNSSSYNNNNSSYNNYNIYYNSN